MMRTRDDTAVVALHHLPLNSRAAWLHVLMRMRLGRAPGPSLFLS